MVLVHMEVLRGEIDRMEVRLRVGRTEVARRRMSVEDHDHMAIVQGADHTIHVVEAAVRTEVEGVVGQMTFEAVVRTMVDLVVGQMTRAVEAVVHTVVEMVVDHTRLDSWEVDRTQVGSEALDCTHVAVEREPVRMALDSPDRMFVVLEEQDKLVEAAVVHTGAEVEHSVVHIHARTDFPEADPLVVLVRIQLESRVDHILSVQAGPVVHAVARSYQRGTIPAIPPPDEHTLVPGSHRHSHYSVSHVSPVSPFSPDPASSPKNSLQHRPMPQKISLQGRLTRSYWVCWKVEERQLEAEMRRRCCCRHPRRRRRERRVSPLWRGD